MVIVRSSPADVTPWSSGYRPRSRGRLRSGECDVARVAGWAARLSAGSIRPAWTLPPSIDEPTGAGLLRLLSAVRPIPRHTC
jgi:hypothetical protein